MFEPEDERRQREDARKIMRREEYLSLFVNVYDNHYGKEEDPFSSTVSVVEKLIAHLDKHNPLPDC